MKGIIKINKKLNLSSFKEIDKGIYKNNFLNRKLGRVGQKYGKDKEEEELKFDVNLSTDEQYFNKSTNSWDERRVKSVHIPIIEKYTKGIKSHENPVVTLMMGAPSSGKGTVRNSINNNYNFGDVTVDPDDIKKVDLKKDYDKYQQENISTAASMVHEESSYLTKKIIDKLIDKKANFTIDKVFSEYDALNRQIQQLVDKGYKVNIVYASLPKEIAYKRMLERGKKEGRYISESYFNKAHDNIVKTFDRIKNDSRLNSIRQYSTNVKIGEKPVLILHKQKDN